MKKRTLLISKYVLVFCAAFAISFQIKAADKAPVLRNGNYKFTIHRADGKGIVFNSLIKDSSGKQIMYIINGSERLLVDSIIKKNDSVFIELPFFESGFEARINANGNLIGEWVKKYGSRIQTMPFTATFNETKRFPAIHSPLFNISGRWAVHFVNHNNKVSKSVGEFNQKGNHFTGTFLNPSGDYRFLEGVVSGDSLYLSGFDGAHAMLFTAKIDNTNKISGGSLYSGKQEHETWTAEKDSKAALPDASSETHVKPAAGKLDFTFPDLNGNPISINDKQFKNKVVVIQILGSWCPNCMDETKFISDNYQFYHDKGVEFLGLAYERNTDFNASVKALQPFKKRFDIKYPILITGVAVSDTLLTKKTLPQIDKIKAFPTTLFIDKKGNISKIHSGFDGPATGAHYTIFKKDFNDIVTRLLNEQ
ncbi:MAG: TlpA disulfide reductase family protein [Ginsengibacter sp.]